jgi:predicted aspartyl protease
MIVSKGIVIISWRSLVIVSSLLFLIGQKSYGQQIAFKGKRTSQSLTFKFIKNLIIIPIYINNKGPYDFLLDTGVGPLIILEPTILDSLKINQHRKMKISGIGLEQVEAYIINDLKVKIGQAQSNQMPAAVLKEDLFNLSAYLGTAIYGIIGYNFFNNFIVEIRYSTNRIKFYKPDKDIQYKGTKILIFIDNQKPYLYARLNINDQNINTRLLMDTGASHALSLETLNNSAFILPKINIPAYLGMSLSGRINGRIARVNNFYLGDYNFKDVVSGFPDYKFFENRLDTNRNGNIGADILRRFDITFNYNEGFIYLKPNKYYKNQFEYDMVGAVTYADLDTDRIFIAEIDKNSPAEKAELLVGDEILSINFKPLKLTNMSAITDLFRQKENRNIVFEILRGQKIIYKVVKTQKRI